MADGLADGSPDASEMPARVHIDVVSDVVCPWCYIGKHRLERALALTPNTPVEVEYQPYFLNPWIPREGIDRKTYLETKFGSVERYAAIAERVAAAAAAEGLVYAPDKMSRQPNTLDCHRLIRWAHGTADPARVKQRLMDLYFAQGADLSDRNVLVQAARECGMDGDLIRRRLGGNDNVGSHRERSECRQGCRHRRRADFHFRFQPRDQRRAAAGLSRRRHHPHCRAAGETDGVIFSSCPGRTRRSLLQRKRRRPRPLHHPALA
jgi:predicted DsbA family dithiol-disulfide isomerase